MENFQQALVDFFTNEKLLKLIRRIGVGLIVVILPLFYFGFKDTFTIEALLTFTYGILMVIVTVSVVLATKETKEASFDLTCENDKELPTLHESIETNSKTIRKLDRTGKSQQNWLSNYNKEQQETYDLELTNERIEKLEDKAWRFRFSNKEKKALKIDREIKHLKTNPLRDKNFVPYSIKYIMNTDRNKFKFKKKKGNPNVNTNPKKLNFKMTLASALLRSSGLGVAGTIPFIINEKTSTVLIFYLGFMVLLFITVLSQWILTGYITTHSYKKGKETVVEIQQAMISDLQNAVPFAELPSDYDECVYIEEENNGMYDNKKTYSQSVYDGLSPTPLKGLDIKGKEE